MNATVHEIRNPKPPTKSVVPELQQRFETLEKMVKQLGETLRNDSAVTLQGRAARAAAVVDLLAEHGALTVADVKKHLGVTMKTANRLLHHVSHAGDGVLIEEPMGGTARLVLFHPDRVVIDDPRK
jgi:hypothetical protein